MSTAPALIPLSEYLSTDYEPDCDYVDGFLEERNVGKKKHSRTQTLLAVWLAANEREGGFQTLTEQRVQVSGRRVRIPDICLVSSDNSDEVTQRPPLLWIEVLSPEDRWNRIQTRIHDALRFGVKTIWIVDPYSKEAWMVTPESGTVAVEDGMLRCAEPALALAVENIWPAE